MDLISLLPLVQPLLNKLSEGKQLRASEANMVLLYSMAESSRDMKDQMTRMSAEVSRFGDTLQGLSSLLSDLRSEVAYVRGKIDD